MAEQFRIISVPLDAPEDYEAMGTKEKFWFHYQELGLCLYKQARLNTGEDWSEKIAAELCKLLGLPHAFYELATFNDTYGIISQSFVPQGATLIPGNEILFPIVPDYPKVKSYKVPQHTVDIVLEAIGNGAVKLPIGWTPPVGINTAVDTFVGYLLLDAWIGNTDRHHENWAFLLHKGGSNQTMIHLAPTYDHASCLGRELQDEERCNRLNTKDAGFSVKRYVEKCTSAL